MGNIKFLCEFDDDADLEIFYTYHGINDGLISQIEIDFENETYALYHGIENYLNGDDPLFDEDDVIVTYVNNTAFEMLLIGIKDMGFKRIDEIMRYNQSVYYTGAKNGSAFDILVCYEDEKQYDIFLNSKYNDACCSIYDSVPICLKKRDFKNKIEELKNLGYKNGDTTDLSNYEYDMWESFYTESKIDNNLVDLIKIDKKGKRYTLCLNKDEDITEDYDIFGNEIYSTYVNRNVFNWIVDGVVSEGYTKTI